MAAPQLGPTVNATLCTPNLERSLEAWCGSLYQHVTSQDRLDLSETARFGIPGLAGARRTMLANELGETWLEIIECTASSVSNPFDHPGWFSLEICVRDVDSLRQELDEDMFQIIGEPANLEMSEHIRAMQVIGPAGEVLYLTEVKAPVPPFDLPFARCPVDRLFIPVLLASDRHLAASVYEQLNGTASMQFDTRITVINRARGFPIETRNPVAALQLAGSNLIEIDQLTDLTARPSPPQGMAAGIAAVSFATKELPTELTPIKTRHGPQPGRVRALKLGAAGERIELVRTT